MNARKARRALLALKAQEGKLAPVDLVNSQRQSGYEHVSYNRPERSNPSSHGGGKRRYQAQSGSDSTKDSFFRGPMRATALEAAQDYCDFANGRALAAVTPLKSAGHTAVRDSLPRDPEVAHALGVLRDARGQREGKQGYVYCIVEDAPAEGRYNRRYCKIGFSTNPEARVAELQTGNPRTLSLLGTIPGTVEDEAAMHQRYIHHNVLQEWFELTPMIAYEFTKTGTVTGRFSAAVPSGADASVPQAERKVA